MGIAAHDGVGLVRQHFSGADAGLPGRTGESAQETPVCLRLRAPHLAFVGGRAIAQSRQSGGTLRRWADFGKSPEESSAVRKPDAQEARDDGITTCDVD